MGTASTGCHLVQVDAGGQEQEWGVLQGWLRRQAPAPLLVVFENAEDSVHVEVGAGSRCHGWSWAVIRWADDDSWFYNALVPDQVTSIAWPDASRVRFRAGNPLGRALKGRCFKPTTCKIGARMLGVLASVLL
jgi:hypothetical protein